MRRTLLLTAALLAASLARAQAPDLDPATPILTNGTATVTARDFEATMTRFPENLRYEARANPQRVATLVDEIYVNRVLAAEARAKGLDKDPLVQLRMKQVEESFLAALAKQDLEKSAVPGDLEARAREIYTANPEKFHEPEAVRAIVVAIEHECRSPEETRAIAKDLVARARAGEDLRALSEAVRVSRTPQRRRAEVVATRAQMDPEAAIWAFDKLKPGEVSDPVDTSWGFTIVKLLDRRPARTAPFEAVREKLMEEERAKLVQMSTDNKIRELKADPNIRLDREALAKLKTEIDAEALRRAAEEARRKARLQ